MLVILPLSRGHQIPLVETNAQPTALLSPLCCVLVTDLRCAVFRLIIMACRRGLRAFSASLIGRICLSELIWQISLEGAKRRLRCGALHLVPALGRAISPRLPSAVRNGKRIENGIHFH